MEHQTRAGNGFYDPAADARAAIKEVNSPKKIFYLIIFAAIIFTAFCIASGLLNSILSNLGPAPWKL